MLEDRDVHVYLLPELVREGQLEGGVAVVIDVLRAMTTVVHALAHGCTCVRPCGSIEEARELADQMRVGKVVLAGERAGKPIAGFDLGNSPRDFSSKRCNGTSLVLTTTNGTQAILKAAGAERVLLAGFVNFSAICEQLKADRRPVHIICAGTEGEPALEDTLLAGAFVDYLCDVVEMKLNDAGRLAWDSFEQHGRVLQGALEVSRGGAILKQLGYDEDIRDAARVDLFHLVPELRRDPLRAEVSSFGIVNTHWNK